MWSKDFKEFVELLNAHRVEYLIVGGHAVGIHGYVRFTGDLDVWVNPEPMNAQRLVAALNEFGFAELKLKADDFSQSRRMLQLGYPPFRIDLMTSADGVVFSECFSRRVTMEYEGVRVDFIGLEDLKCNKKAAGRGKDLIDLDELG